MLVLLLLLLLLWCLLILLRLVLTVLLWGILAGRRWRPPVPRWVKLRDVAWVVLLILVVGRLRRGGLRDGLTGPAIPLLGLRGRRRETRVDSIPRPRRHDGQWLAAST